MIGLALAAFSPHRWTDVGGRAICLWTRSQYSHVELVVPAADTPWDKQWAPCYSSSLQDGGVRDKPIDLRPKWWSVFPVNWRDPDEAWWVYQRYKGKPYGWGDLITQHVLRLPVDCPGLPCSDLCARMLGLPDPVAQTMTPGQLVEYVISRNAK